MAAGVDWIQIREKDLSTRALEDLVRRAVSRGGSSRILVNDRLDVALACGAAGVHLPADGLPVDAVRRSFPTGLMVGVSTHTEREAETAAKMGADFIVFGPVFATASKPGVRPVGLRALAEVVAENPLPVFALGGITAHNVEEVAGTGVAGVAGISAFQNEQSLMALQQAISRLRQ